MAMLRTGNPALQGDDVPRPPPRAGRGGDDAPGHRQQDRALAAHPARRRRLRLEQRGPVPAVFILLGLVGGLVAALVTVFKKTGAPYTTPVYAALRGPAAGRHLRDVRAALRGHRHQRGGPDLRHAGRAAARLLAPASSAPPRTSSSASSPPPGAIAPPLPRLDGAGLLRRDASPTSTTAGPIGIAFSLFVVVIAALNLVLDFDFIERGAAAGAPQVHGVGGRLRPAGHAGLAVPRDPAPAGQAAGPEAARPRWTSPRIQNALAEQEIDGWLLYDFRGSNPIARSVIGFDESQIGTRRWFYLIPRQGEPVAHPARDRAARAQGRARPVGRSTAPGRSWRRCCATHLRGHEARGHGVQPRRGHPLRRPRGRGHGRDGRGPPGVEVVSSADLVQIFEARWTPEQKALHDRPRATPCWPRTRPSPSSGSASPQRRCP